MRIALFSDIHGNLVGLRAVLARLDEFGGVDVIFALGDFLAVGPGGDDLIELLLSRKVRMVRGNWDEIFLDPDAYLKRFSPETRAIVAQHYDWLLRNTSQATRDLIAELPLTDQLETPAGHRLYACHAAPTDTWSRHCSADADPQTLHAVYAGIDAHVIAYDVELLARLSQDRGVPEVMAAKAGR